MYAGHTELHGWDISTEWIGTEYESYHRAETHKERPIKRRIKRVEENLKMMGIRKWTQRGMI